MRDRFNQAEVWERLGLPVEECMDDVHYNSSSMQSFRTPPVHPHRADRQGHRPVGPAGAEGATATWA